jgi:DNA-binding FadR family transcriptional regulator
MWSTANIIGATRTALRDRLSYLESMGILERRTGAGTFVKELRPETLSEALMLGLIASHMTLSSLTSVRWPWSGKPRARLPWPMILSRSPTWLPP